jgi:flagella synthesis protein FlgN
MSITQQLLSKQTEQLLLLEQFLLDEKEIIQKNQINELAQITDKKKSLLLSIENLDKNIAEQADFLANKSAGMYNEELTTIETILERCKELNAVNGQLISQSQLAVERLKNNILEKHSKSTITYDSKGKTQGGLSSLGIKA